MLYFRIKKLSVIAVALVAALSISSCTIGDDVGLSTQSDHSNSAQNQNDSIPIQTVRINSNQNTSEAAHQTIQTDPVYTPLSVTSDPQNSPGVWGAGGAVVDQDLTLADMLTYAIEDEYLAHGEYQYILDTLGSLRPFSNIIKAEETHISLLQPLFEQYTVPVPADKTGRYLILPSSIIEALQTGVQAEIDNIAMYDKFLEQDLPDDVRQIFIDLRDASVNHLDAFQKTRG